MTELHVPEMPVTERVAWTLGYKAYEFGRNVNPYPETSDPFEHIAWSNGWHAAQRDAQPAKEQV